MNVDYVKLPVPYVRQEAGLKLIGRHQTPASLCGPACIQMVLTYLGWNSAGVDIRQQQNDWLDAARQMPLPVGEESYMCSPTGLRRTLDTEAQKLQPHRGAPTRVAPVPGAEAEEMLTRLVVWSLHNAMPAVALTLLSSHPSDSDSADHWIVVVGCTTDVKPQSATDTAFQVLALEFHNPWVVGSAVRPPTRPPQQVTYLGWRRRYLAKADAAPFAGQVVAVLGT